MEAVRALYYAFLDEENLVANVFIYNWKGEKDYIKIMNISVHPKYRGQGLACKLMNHVRNEMSMIEMKRFCGETRSSNKAMQTVFEKCGYHLDRIEEKYFQNPDEKRNIVTGRKFRNSSDCVLSCVPVYWKQTPR